MRGAVCLVLLLAACMGRSASALTLPVHHRQVAMVATASSTLLAFGLLCDEYAEAAPATSLADIRDKLQELQEEPNLWRFTKTVDAYEKTLKCIEDGKSNCDVDLNYSKASGIPKEGVDEKLRERVEDMLNRIDKQHGFRRYIPNFSKWITPRHASNGFRSRISHSVSLAANFIGLLLLACLVTVGLHWSKAKQQLGQALLYLLRVLRIGQDAPTENKSVLGFIIARLTAFILLPLAPILGFFALIVNVNQFVMFMLKNGKIPLLVALGLWAVRFTTDPKSALGMMIGDLGVFGWLAFLAAVGGLIVFGAVQVRALGQASPATREKVMNVPPPDRKPMNPQDMKHLEGHFAHQRPPRVRAPQRDVAGTAVRTP